MLYGIGIDLVEIGRFARALSRHGVRLERRLFTELELLQCETRHDRVQALAARFAAKEACLKALGTGWSQGLAFIQVEVVRESGGRPRLRLHGAAESRARGEGVKRMHLSLTHQPGAAAAVVILEV